VKAIPISEYEIYSYALSFNQKLRNTYLLTASLVSNTAIEPVSSTDDSISEQMTRN